MTDHHIHPKLKAWGHYAFTRHCVKLGIPFDDCYWMIFGRYPTKTENENVRYMWTSRLRHKLSLAG